MADPGLLGLLQLALILPLLHYLYFVYLTLLLRAVRQATYCKTNPGSAAYTKVSFFSHFSFFPFSPFYSLLLINPGVQTNMLSLYQTFPFLCLYLLKVLILFVFIYPAGIYGVHSVCYLLFGTRDTNVQDTFRGYSKK